MHQLYLLVWLAVGGWLLALMSVIGFGQWERQREEQALRRKLEARKGKGGDDHAHANRE